MECTEFERELNDLLDAREPVETLLDERLEAHIDACAACREWFTSLVNALETVSIPAAISPPAGLAARVVGEIKQHSSRPAVHHLHVYRSRPVRFRQWALAAVASVAAVLMIWAYVEAPDDWLANSNSADPAVETATKNASATNTAARGETTPTISVHAHDDPAPEAFDIARQTQYTLAVAWQMLPGLFDDSQASDSHAVNPHVGVSPVAAGRAASADSRAANPTAVDHTWSDEVRAGLQPVTHSTTSALDALWRLLPPAEEDARS